MSKKIKQEETSLPLGTLFESVEYFKLEDLDKFITDMNHDQALYCLIQACQSAYNRNVFTMLESEVLSKALRKMTTPNVVNN